MPKLIVASLLIFLPLLLIAAELNVNIDLSNCSPASELTSSGWGSLSAPGYPQLPVKTVNIIIPAGIEDIQYSHQFSGLQTIDAPAPVINPPFSDGERILSAPQSSLQSQQVQFLGIKHWGEVTYASFRVLPAIYNLNTWQCYSNLQINLSWTDASAATSNRIPTILRQLEKSSLAANSFFANPGDLNKWYKDSPAKNYDYLIVSTPALYAAVSPLEVFHQGQGMITAFTDIATILASSPGATDGEKLRNYLVGQYNANPFSYLLLVGDYDTVPVMMLIPEPDGMETIPSDFFYGDLSSIPDTDGDSRIGEYSPGAGQQDFLCDFTPEVFVGRISTNSATLASQIASRTVAYEQSTEPWKQKVLLPAAFLNYGGEPETIYLQTDGATSIEYARNTVLRDRDCTTMYEQIGFVPSYPSDLALDYDLLKNELSTTSYGILNWSAHGSSTSSSRKVWMNDDNANLLPDSWEMDWLNMVNRQSFDNLVNQDGLILFAASCYNGMIDDDQQCLAEYALQKKAVNALGATRTGWYKIGWRTPGWGGLSSYNHHWLENIVQNGMSSGAATAYANLTHTQYYLFGDPVDSNGIIWPELQNVYTYLLYGDPAVGHTAEQTAPLGEILVYEPIRSNGLPVVNALNATGRFNVVYTDRLIPDYDYLNQFEAVFCLFGWGDTAYILNPGSMEYNMLNSYLANGGKMYLEGDVGWDSTDDFWGKFGTHAQLDVVAYIGGIRYFDQMGPLFWNYDQTDPYTYALLLYSTTAFTLFIDNNLEPPHYGLAIFNDAAEYKTIASALALDSVLPAENDLSDMLSVILQKFGLIAPPVANEDPLAQPEIGSVTAYPNPFSSEYYLRVDLKGSAPVVLDIFNIRGQKVRSFSLAASSTGTQDIRWDGLDSFGKAVSPGIYFWRLQSGNSLQQGKMLKISH